MPKLMLSRKSDSVISAEPLGISNSSAALSWPILPLPLGASTARTSENALRQIVTRSELATCDPEYYKHQQKLFLDFNRLGLVARKESNGRQRRFG